MNTWLIIGVVLLAVLVGALVPVLVQLFLTLRHARAFMDHTGRRMDRTLDEVMEAASRINRVGSELEGSALRLKEFFEAAGEMGRTLDRLRHNLGAAAVVGSAVGPAIAAALRALWSQNGADAPATQRESVAEESARTDTAEHAQPVKRQERST